MQRFDEVVVRGLRGIFGVVMNIHHIRARSPPAGASLQQHPHPPQSAMTPLSTFCVSSKGVAALTTVLCTAVRGYAKDTYCAFEVITLTHTHAVQYKSKQQTAVYSYISSGHTMDGIHLDIDSFPRLMNSSSLQNFFFSC